MKDTNTKRIINYSGAILIIIAIVLLFMSQTTSIEEIRNPQGTIDLKIEELSEIQQTYFDFRAKMYGLESSIQEFGNIGIMIVAVLLFYALKSFLSIVPISATCLLSGIIFPFPVAILVNYAGLALQISIKYFWGKKIGGGNISKILKRYPSVLEVVEQGGNGNLWFLFIFRLVPSFPINPISQMYGNMKIDYKNYLIISLTGVSMKIILFTLIGSNVFDPLSSAFITPIIIILFISGFSMLLINGIVSLATKLSDNKSKEDNNN